MLVCNVYMHKNTYLAQDMPQSRVYSRGPVCRFQQSLRKAGNDTYYDLEMPKG